MSAHPQPRHYWQAEHEFAQHVADLLDTAAAYSGDPLAAGWVVEDDRLTRDNGDGTVLELRVRVRDE
jgi:hypothetical protein